MKKVLPYVAAALLVAACTPVMTEYVTPAAQHDVFAVPDGCNFHAVRAGNWTCQFITSEGRERSVTQYKEDVIYVQDRILPAEQMPELATPDRTALRELYIKMISEIEKSDDTVGRSGPTYRSIGSGFLPESRTPQGYTVCLSDRFTYLDAVDYRLDSIYLHCFGYDEDEDRHVRMGFFFSETNPQARSVSQSYEADAERIIRSIRRR